MTDSTGFGKFDDFVSKKASATNLPSVTTIMVKGGEVVHSFAYGFRDLDTRTPASVETLYGVGSVTKSFTALAIAKLVEEGKVDFHDKVTKFLPLKQKAFRDVEIHNLLTHTSGIPGLGFSEVQIYTAMGSYNREPPIVNFDDVISFLDEVDDWVESKPGEKLFYLNEGYHLLGDIVSEASGRPYAEYVTEAILKPLGMKRAYFTIEQIEIDNDRATPYIIKNGKATASAIFHGGAAGGLVESAADLAKYLVMLTNGGELGGKRIVSKATLERMETPYVSWATQAFPEQGYGYGLVVIPDFYGHKVMFHGGSVEVYTSSFAYSRSANCGIAVLANGSGYSMDRIALYGMAVLMDRNPEQLPTIKLDNLLERVEGEYAAYKSTVLAEVRRNGSFLMLSGEDIGENIVLVPESEDTNAALFFTLSGTAKLPVEFRFNQHGTEMVYERYKYRKTGPIKPKA